MKQERLWTSAAVYSRPTMDEIRGRPLNGLTAVGSFSGCGGSSLGLRMAGWNVPYAIEFVPAAADTYQRNMPDAHVDRRDVRKVKGEEILEHVGLERGELDLFEGSPPCASFSHAGNRTKAWGEEKLYSGGIHQQTDDLFWEWTRLVDELLPRGFIAENVPAMLNGRALDEYARKVVTELAGHGYQIHARVVNSAWYGVPQDRERLLFMGLRKDVADLIGVHQPQFPPQTVDDAFTIAQALEDAEPLDPEEVEACDMRGSKMGISWEAVVSSRERFGSEPDYVRLPCGRCDEPMIEHSGLQITDSGYVTGGTCADGEPADPVKHYFMLRVPKLGEPSPTVVALSGSIHPTECRYLTRRELLSISGFPADFQLTGTMVEGRERIGRAVTPPVYEAVGKRLAEYLSGNANGESPSMFEDSRPGSRILSPEARTY